MADFSSLFETKDFLVIGHRGAAGLEAENTLSSFQKAIELDCQAVELDVQVARDNKGEPHLLILHDEKVDRTTDGQGSIKDLRFEEIRDFKCANGEKVPTLNEVLELISASAQKRIGVNIELKGVGTAELVSVELERFTDLPILVSSFDHAELSAFKTFAPAIQLAPLFHFWRNGIVNRSKTFESGFCNISKRIASKERIRELVSNQLRPLVYTVNEMDTANQFKKNGSSGIFTDRPDLFVQDLY